MIIDTSACVVAGQREFNSRIPATPELLREAMGCTAALADMHAPHLDAVCQHYHISSVNALAMFFAQLGHESGSLRHVREIWGPTPAQIRYEVHPGLGNTEPGDGRRFMGRGWIQVTGRANYRRVTQRLHTLAQERPELFESEVPDFEEHPHLLELPWWAAWASGEFWDRHGLNVLAEAGDVRRVTRIINGGFNGLEDREQRYSRALRVLRAWQTVAVPMFNPEPASEAVAPAKPYPVAAVATGAGAAVVAAVAVVSPDYSGWAVLIGLAAIPIAASVWLMLKRGADDDDRI